MILLKFEYTSCTSFCVFVVFVFCDELSETLCVLLKAFQGENAAAEQERGGEVEAVGEQSESSKDCPEITLTWEVKFLGDVNICGKRKANILAGHIHNGKSVLDRKKGTGKLVEI